MNGNRAINFTAPAEQAAQGELDFRGIAVGLRHARKDLGRMVEAIIDQMVEADVVVSRQPHGSRGAITAAEYPGGNADRYESQCEQDGWQLDHTPKITAEVLQRHARQSRMGRSAPSLTRSRKSFPGLKCGTYLPDNATASPVFGLRPWRGGRKCSEKLPKPRISMRSPCESASLMISSICFSASSTSLAGRCFCFAVMISMSSDFVTSLPVLMRSMQSSHQSRSEPICSFSRSPRLVPEEVEVSER